MFRDFREDLARALPGSELFRCLHTDVMDNTWGQRCLEAVGGSDIASSWQLEARWDAWRSLKCHCVSQPTLLIRELKHAVGSSMPSAGSALGCWKTPARTCFAPDKSPSTGLLRGEGRPKTNLQLVPPRKIKQWHFNRKANPQWQGEQ